MPASTQAQSINYGQLEEIFQEPVTTSATGTPQRASEVATDMTIITADQIRQAGTRNLPEIIGIYTPGVNVLQEGVNSFDLGIRGYQQPYNPRLLVLIDGRQVFSDDYSRTPWDNLPVNIDDIRQIEIVKGASSALFGSNATGGVVNIITYNPIYDNNNTLSISGGTQHNVNGDGTVMTKIANVDGMKVSGGGLNQSPFSHGFDHIADASPIDDLYHRYLVADNVFKASPSFLINTEFTYSEKYNSESLTTTSTVPVYTLSYSARGGFSWASPIGQIKNDNYINTNKLHYEYGGGIVPYNSLIVSRLEDLVEVGSKNTFRGMLEFRNKYSIVSDQTPFYDEQPELNDKVYAIGGTWLSHLTDKISLTNAIRYDTHSIDLSGRLQPSTPLTPVAPTDAYNQHYSTISANSGISYAATDDDTFRLTYGRGVQDPSLVNLGYDVSNFTGGSVAALVGNPYLKPVIVNNYGVGYDRKLKEISSVARFSAYYETNRDMIAVEPYSAFDGVHFFNVFQEVNAGQSQGWGGEADLNGKSSNGFRWDLSYSYEWVHDDSQVANYLNNNGSAPHHQLRASLGYTTGPWEFDMHHQLASPTSMNVIQNTFGALPVHGIGTINTIYSKPLPFYIGDAYTMTARIGYKITDNFTVAVYGSNLTHALTAASPYTEIERRVFTSLTAQF